MVSSITQTPSNHSIYSNVKYNIAIKNLITSAIKKEPLNDGQKNDLDELFILAKNNDQDSIELLQNLSLSGGDVSSYAQDLLCKLVAKEDAASYDAACSARSGCQRLITNFSDGIITNDTLENNPKLLLIAGSKIEGDALHLDPIPLQVKSKIESFDKNDVKPQWWHETNLVDGQFETPKPSTIKDKNNWVKEFKLLDDGACQFRAVFILRYKDRKWLSAPKSDISKEIEKYPETVRIIKDSITNSYTALKQIEIPHSEKVKVFFEKKGFEDVVYNKCIKSGDFTLYSPQGLAAAINELDVDKNSDDYVFLENLADSIGTNLTKNVFNLPLSSDGYEAYVVPTGNHYNLITPVGFFQKE